MIITNDFKKTTSLAHNFGGQKFRMNLSGWLVSGPCSISWDGYLLGAPGIHGILSSLFPFCPNGVLFSRIYSSGLGFVQHGRFKEVFQL